jgi:hypothetical protein
MEQAMNLPDSSMIIYKQAKTQKQAILAEMASIESKQGELKQQLADIEGFLRTFARWGLPPQQEIVAEKPISAKTKPINKQSQVAKAVCELLATGDIMTTNQILDALASRGLDIGGENPAGNLSAILSKASELSYSRAAKGWLLASSDAGGRTPDPSQGK